MALPFVTDSRRMTGANLFHDSPGAVLEVRVPAELERVLVMRWRKAARGLLDSLGWTQQQTAVRRHAKGTQLAVESPIDLALVATYINEDAWEIALGQAGQIELPDVLQILAGLRRRVERERKPQLIKLLRKARQRHLTALTIDGDFSAGAGAGCLHYPRDALPDVSEVPWARAHNVPFALITGTNGKTTTTRLLARMLKEAGHTVAYSSTDFVMVDDQIVDRGDYSGPGGARLALRDPRTTVAVLETARGGMNRRGLAVTGASVAAITNIQPDHLGDEGLDSLEDIAEVKFIIAKGLKAGAPLVLNRDDERLRRRAHRVDHPILWTLKDPPAALKRRFARERTTASFVDDGMLTYFNGVKAEPIAAVHDLPMTFGGAAVHNIDNALTALTLAKVLKAPNAAIARALKTFGTDPNDNPGRTNVFRLRNGAIALVDYAHNADGIRAVFDAAHTFPAARTIVVMGQAGDRSDSDIRALAQRIAAERPALVVIKQMAAMARGRGPTEVQDLLYAEFLAHGMNATQLIRAETDSAATASALALTQPDDLLVLLIHSERDAVFAQLRAAQ
jgi:cyanophycin synthetase